MSEFIYTIEELIEISKNYKKTEIQLSQDEIIKFKDLCVMKHKNHGKLQRPQAIDQSGKMYEPIQKKIKHKLVEKDSISVRILEARTSFNSANKANFLSVVKTMIDKKIEDRNYVEIFLNAAITSAESEPQKSSIWEVWALLLKEFKKAKKEVTDLIKQESIKEFKKLIAKPVQTDADLRYLLSAGCWLATLYNADIFTIDEYCRSLKDVIIQVKNTNNTKYDSSSYALSILCSSLFISGKKIDIHNNDIQNNNKTAFLFSFLARNKRNNIHIESYLRILIFDLLELRKNDWDKNKVLASISRNKSITTKTTASTNVSTTKSKKLDEGAIVDFLNTEFSLYSLKSDEEKKKYSLPSQNYQTNLLMKDLFFILTKQNGQKKVLFINFALIILKQYFPYDSKKDNFFDLVQEIKAIYTNEFSSEDETQQSEYFKRLYTITSQYILSQAKDIMPLTFFNLMIDIYYNPKTFNKGKTLLSPIPSSYIVLIRDQYINTEIESSEILSIKQCNDLSLKLPNDFHEFNSIVYHDESKDDYCSFLIEVVSLYYIFEPPPEEYETFLEEIKSKDKPNPFEITFQIYSELFNILCDVSEDDVQKKKELICNATSLTQSLYSTEKYYRALIEAIINHLSLKDQLIKKMEIDQIFKYIVQDLSPPILK